LAFPTTSSRPSPADGVAQTFRASLAWLAAGAVLLAPPVLRIALALPFFRSGLTRWDGFLSLSPSTLYLFENMFKLHILGGEYSFPFPDVVGMLVGMAEITLPILLVLGLGTRLVALGLLLMTGIIQLVVPDGWVNFHLYWAAIALAIIALGGGPLSVDRLIVWFTRVRRLSIQAVSVGQSAGPR
jgi:putative oxidoreductase